MLSIIQIQVTYTSEKICMPCDLYLQDMTLGQCHDKTFGHEERLCEGSSKSNLLVKSYIPDKKKTWFCVHCDLKI